jgi:NADH-quinone oxidoreductase subunit G
MMLAKSYLGALDFFVSGRSLGRGDQILMNEDKNPNTRGAMRVAGATSPRPFAELLDAIRAGRYAFVLALGGDIEVDAQAAQAALSKLKGLITIASHEGPLSRAAHITLPACSWAEADGTYVNVKGMVQRSERALHPRGDARPGWELVARLGRSLGYAVGWKNVADLRRSMDRELVEEASGSQRESVAAAGSQVSAS